MTESKNLSFQTVSKAIAYLTENFKQQPSLATVAAYVNLSPQYFQKVFTELVGISPKKFVQFLNLNYAKRLIDQENTNLFETAFATGLSGTGRLHDLFVNMEGMTPGAYKTGAEDLQIAYCFEYSVFGKILIANTPKGICHLAFIEDENDALAQLRKSFPNAKFENASNDLQAQALAIFRQEPTTTQSIKLHLKGSPFQLKVWEALLNIPFGKLSTYGSIAKEIASPAAARAVGTAIGSNPVALIIPCHRVIQNSGKLGGYLWGLERKAAILSWEAAQLTGETY